MSLLNPGFKLCEAVRNWVDRCVAAEDTTFLEYVITGENRRVQTTAYDGENRRKIIKLNDLAVQVAGPEIPPDAAA